MFLIPPTITTSYMANGNCETPVEKGACVGSCLVDLDEAYEEFMSLKKPDKKLPSRMDLFRKRNMEYNVHMSPPAAIEASDSSSDSESSTELGRKSPRRVSFADVSFREYEVTVADSPAAASIYPIGLGWKHSDTVTLDLHDFENSYSAAVKNPFSGTIRGFRKPRRLSTADRFTRLANFSGLSPEELYDLEMKRSLRTKKAQKEKEESNDCTISFQQYQRVDLDQFARLAV